MNPSADALADALARLPHGSEFLFLDRLSRLVPGHEGEGEYHVRGDESFLRGHFPRDPIFPGVLVVEAAAQLAGVVAQSDPRVPPLAVLKLSAIHRAKITGAARPGDLLRLEARITGRLGVLIMADVTAAVAGSTLLEASVTLAGAEPRSGCASTPRAL
jgi:3-hydroxymyristoyl/3-hydroxydecanoyl-(acyl carrier protein) dehydratase